MGLFGIGGVVITILMVGSSLFFVFRLLASLSAGEKERQRLLQTGAPAQARILQVQMGGMTVTTGVNRQLQLHVAVEVHRPGMAPYNAQITTLVSELQIPQVQPGVWIAVRVDPANPQSMAIEAFGVAPPGAQGAPQPGYGAPQAGYGAPPGYGPQPGYGAPQPGYGPPAGMPGPQPGYGAPQPGYGPPAGVAPMGGFRMPMGAKIGLGIGLVCAVIGVGVAVMAVGWTSGIGGPSDTCKKAAACCRKMAGANAAASNCDNYTKQNGPIADKICEETLKSYKQTGVCK